MLLIRYLTLGRFGEGDGTIIIFISKKLDTARVQKNNLNLKLRMVSLIKKYLTVWLRMLHSCVCVSEMFQYNTVSEKKSCEKKISILTMYEAPVASNEESAASSILSSSISHPQKQETGSENIKSK